MSESMVRRVAKALREDLRTQAANDSLVLDCEALARAAIEAMREPTPEMLQALAKRYSYHNTGDEPYDGEARDYWQAMITAALGKQEG